MDGILAHRGHIKKHQPTFRKFSFAARIVNIWNSLPDYVVDVNSVAVFNKSSASAEVADRNVTWYVL